LPENSNLGQNQREIKGTSHEHVQALFTRNILDNYGNEKIYQTEVTDKNETVAVQRAFVVSIKVFETINQNILFLLWHNSRILLIIYVGPCRSMSVRQ
jgi:hypothetical protein